MKIIRLVQHPGQHLTTELVEKWEAEINSFKSQASVKSTLQEQDIKPLKLGQDGGVGAHLTLKEIEIYISIEFWAQNSILILQTCILSIKTLATNISTPPGFQNLAWDGNSDVWGTSTISS